MQDEKIKHQIRILDDVQAELLEEYVKNKKHEIWGDTPVGDIAELGLIAEELGEAMHNIRKLGTKDDLAIECADIIIRAINFMSRKDILLGEALFKAHQKNKERSRKGLMIFEPIHDGSLGAFNRG